MTASSDLPPAGPGRVDAVLALLTLDEKASLTAGDDVWHLPGIERLGIGRLKVSDGPSGARGERIGTRRSMAFPCGTAMGATWDVELIGRLGVALGQEAADKGAHVLLGPTVCIPRTPLGGRTFESFAEDPWLSARLAVAYVRGVQGTGVGCCVKHFACNDQEHERMTISVQVDERTLREVHLPSFEAAVTEAGAWSVMSAYNRVDGEFSGEHRHLLGEVLKGEWGFDGVVVSDWGGTHSTVAAALAGLDVEMPGRADHLGPHLAAAVRAGDVSDAVLDDHARRILRLLDRAGVLDQAPSNEEHEHDDEGRRRTARAVAVAGTVLLRNDGVLPLDPTAALRVAVIGPNADRLEAGGGGSSAVVPHRTPSLVDELRDRLPAAELAFERGCRIDRGVPTIEPWALDDGFVVTYFADPAFGGEPVLVETAGRGQLVLLGAAPAGLALDAFSARATGTFRPDVSGPWRLGVANAGAARLLLDGEVVVDNTEPTPGGFFFGLGSRTVDATVELEAGRAYELTVDLWGLEGLPLAGFQVGAGRPPVADELDRAVAAAEAADVAVVVVGSNGQWETEGRDRRDLHLVGDQDELVRRVAEANPRTVVVVNAGAPVDLACAEAAAAVLVVWYPGEEGAPALADVVAGLADPGGRLPLTFPARIEDGAAHGRYPGAGGQVTYAEGVFIGHRHLDAHGIEPAFAFGHGLSYAAFDLGRPEVVVAGDGRSATTTTTVTNVGSRAGTEVVQLYVGAVAPSVPRPPLALAAFAKVALGPGESTEVVLEVGERAFSIWDVEQAGWRLEPGAYDLALGRSSRDLPHRTQIELRA
ncbi:glycoside hydrolase family 3 C-terminal domain-containing protein [Aquihabitans sp. G128]|uniref:glycoside hydrolase family 3 C-terminal domain-containing protein n=1 Tax=Aquihabitans sp. G128 TaxID=2849779 RepID=UPI001C25138F|nr:glycoside hydrolase family 3 C-terminal domain-containing protein [Aquihabitans sp. G128]QXC61646.1 glycoside hydrolase family 3 C-terminal domain-containing protein [Aquihabitans sp. G128]